MFISPLIIAFLNCNINNDAFYKYGFNCLHLTVFNKLLEIESNDFYIYKDLIDSVLQIFSKKYNVGLHELHFDGGVLSYDG